MSYSKLIHEYLDEGLPEVQEATLFAELAADASLRTEFNKQVQLHLLAQNDMNSITPPIDITNGVFTSLGFAIPTPEPVENKPGFFARYSKYGVMTLLLIVASILPVSIYYTYDNYFADNSQSSINTTQEENGLSDNALTSANSIPVTSSESMDELSDNNILASDNDNSGQGNTARSRSNNGSERANLFASDSENSNNSLSSTNSNNGIVGFGSENSEVDVNTSNNHVGSVITDNEKIESSEHSFPQDMASRYKVVNISNTSQNFSNPNVSSRALLVPVEDSYTIYDNLTIDNTRFAVAIKGISIENAFPNNQAGSFNQQDNVNVAVFYKLDAYNAIGVEFGREQFAQEFTRMIAGKEHQQFQTPSIYWGGITYRLIVPDWAIMNRIIPYAQFSAGINNIGGALFKVQPGFEWRIGKNMSFILAGDISSIFYNYDNVIYDSEKFGFVYGVNVNF